MTWEGEQVTVTGAGGFIGSHLVELLARDGATVRAFVRYNSRGDQGNLRFVDPELRSRVVIDYGDLRDEDAVHGVMEGSGHVFHLGALIAIPYSYQHPREVVETNVIGTLNVLQAARRTKPERVVHVSTSEVYGSARRIPIDESHPLQGQSPYSASKIGADKIAESFHRAFDVPVVTVRPFNAYGPRQSARAVIPTIVSQTLAGPRIRLGSLTPTRDFTFVGDTVRGMALAAGAAGAEGLEVNLGSNAAISIGELVGKIAAILGTEVEVESDDERVRPANSEVERLHADNTRARDLLGWRPAVGLDDGLRETIAWITAHRDMYRPAEYQV